MVGCGLIKSGKPRKADEVAARLILAELGRAWQSKRHTPRALSAMTAILWKAQTHTRGLRRRRVAGLDSAVIRRHWRVVSSATAIRSRL